jgi:sugar phosphate isomerase/epimerase
MSSIQHKNTRRQLLTAGAALFFSPLFSTGKATAAGVQTQPSFRYSLNFGTLRGFRLPLEEEIKIAAKAGYDAVEPWVRELDDYQKNGGKFSDIRKMLDDSGLAVAGGIAFFQWLTEDKVQREKGLEQMKRDMDLCASIGGNRIAATASGATNQRLDNFAVLGERYREILETGEQTAVIPQLEVWGKSQTMNCLADVLAIAAHSGHPKAEILLDVFHLFRGGTQFDSLSLVHGKKMTNFHFNDYPAQPPREQQEDKDRIYPGDGAAPLKKIIRILQTIGFNGFLSFEVFNQSYWASGDPLQVAKTGLEKMKAIVNSANVEQKTL